MGKKASKLPPESERVRYFLDFLFAGNQSKMADALGIPQPVISRVVTGKLRPGKQLLAALIAHPKVNPAWLAAGKGDPLLATETATAEGWPVPVASCLLPGLPSACQKMLTPLVQFVPGVMFRDSLYAIRARHAVPQDIAEALHILPEDHLLIESDRSVWDENLSVLNDRLVVIRVAGDDAQEVVLREAQVSGEAGEQSLTVLSAEQMRERPVLRAKADKARQEYGREPREITFRDKSSARDVAKQSVVTASQIAGLVVQLIRNF